MGVDRGRRGQAHTLEAFSASLVLLAAIVFALQVTAVTPLTASTASQHLENQQSGVAAGVLDAAAAAGELKPTVLNWNNTSEQFEDSGGVFTNGGPPTAFGQRLNETFDERGLAFSVTLRWVNDGSIDHKRIVNMGSASDNAISATRTVVVYDDEHLYDSDGTVNTSEPLNNRTTYLFLDSANPNSPIDQSPNSPVFLVVQVEVTVWRM